MSIGGAILRIQPAASLGYGTDPFRLIEGQRLRGLVLQSHAGEADLLLGGRLVHVRTDLRLTPGLPLDLHVRRVTGARVTLSLVAGEPAAAPGLRQLTTDDLHEVALALRLPTSERTLSIMRELLANGQPLTTAAVQRVLAVAQMVNLPAGVSPRPLVWLIARGVPVTPETLALAAAALPERELLPAIAAPGALPAARLMAQAATADRLLARVTAELPPSAQGPALALRGLLNQLGLAGPGADATAPDVLAGRLMALAESLATPPEAKLGRLLGPAATPAAPTEAVSRTSIPGRAAGDGRHPSPPPSSQEAHRESAVMPALVAGGALLARTADLRLLVHRTLAALRAATPPDTANQSASAHQAAHAALTHLEAGLEFAQVANATGAEPATGRHTVWLALPLPPGPDGQPPTLAVTQWDGTTAGDQPRRLRAHLTLSLPHLGNLAISLDLLGEHLRCEIQAAAASAARIQPELDELGHALAALGYTVDTAVTIAQPVVLPTLTPPPLRRLDHRV